MQTIDQLVNSMNVALPTNGVGAITAAVLRGALEDYIRNSAEFYEARLSRSVIDFADGLPINDGVTDARDAILAGLTWATTFRGTLYFPAGKYLLSALIDLTNVATGSQETPLSFRIEGDGPRASIIFLPTANDTGGIAWTMTGGDRKWMQFAASNISIQAEGTKDYHILTIDATDVGAVQQISHIHIDNFDIWGTDIDVPVTSEFMLNLPGVFRPIIRDCRFIAYAGDNDWENDSLAFTCKRGVNLDGAYGGLVTNSIVCGARTAWSSVGLNQEGVRMLVPGAINSMTGFRWRRGDGTPVVITGITKANPGVVSYTGVDPANGDTIFITGLVGMVDVYDREFQVKNVNAGANTFQLGDPITGANVNTTGYDAYVSGGTFQVYGGGFQPAPQIMFGHLHCREACLDLSGVQGWCLGPQLDLAVTADAATPYNGHGFGVWAKGYRNFIIDGLTIAGTNHYSGFVGIMLDAKDSGEYAEVRTTKINAVTDPGLYAIWRSGDTTSVVRDIIIQDNAIFSGGYIKNDSAPAGNGPMSNYMISSERGVLRIETEQSDANIGATLLLMKKSPSPAVNDLLTSVILAGVNSNQDPINYAALVGRSVVLTPTSEDGALDVYLMSGGGFTHVGTIGKDFAHFAQATSVASGGTTGAGLRLGQATNFGVFYGSDAPSISAAKGSLYLRSNGSGVNDRAYIATDSVGGWTAIVTVA